MINYTSVISWGVDLRIIGVIPLVSLFWMGCSQNGDNQSRPAPVEGEEGSLTGASGAEDAGDAEQDDDSNLDCINTEITLEDLDAPTPAGVTAREVFKSAMGTFQFRLQKVDVQDPITTFSPDSDGVSASVSLEYKPDGLRFIESKTPVIPEGIKASPHCPDVFSARVMIRFRSEDGAFADEWEAIITHDIPGSSDNHKGKAETPRIRLSVALPIDRLVGDFSLEQPKSYPPEKTRKHNVLFLLIWHQVNGIEGGLLRARWWGKPQPGPGNSTKKSYSGLDLYTLVPTQ